MHIGFDSLRAAAVPGDLTVSVRLPPGFTHSFRVTAAVRSFRASTRLAEGRTWRDRAADAALDLDLMRVPREGAHLDIELEGPCPIIVHSPVRPASRFPGVSRLMEEDVAVLMGGFCEGYQTGDCEIMGGWRGVVPSPR